MRRTLIPTRVIEQVILVVPFGIVPFTEGGELGDDRSAFEAVVAIVKVIVIVMVKQSELETGLEELAK